MVLGELKTAPYEWDRRFMRMAADIAAWSKDPEVKVGAVVVSDDRRRFSVGYNGFPRGVTDTKERLRGSDRVPLMAHAELNAILNAKTDLNGWTLYSTRQPCIECAKAIIQSGLARVVAAPVDPSSSWAASCIKAVELMREAGVKVDLVSLQ